MESLNPTAKNVETDLQTPTISDLLPETTTPVKQAANSGSANAPTPAPALDESDGNHQTLAEYIVDKIAGDDLAYKAELEESALIIALRHNPSCNQSIKGLNPQARGHALKLARELEIVSPNPTQPHMIRMPHSPHTHIISSWATLAARHTRHRHRKVTSSVICRAIDKRLRATPAARHMRHNNRKVTSVICWAIWATNMRAARRQRAICWAMWATNMRAAIKWRV